MMLQDKYKEKISEDEFGREKIVDTIVQVIDNVSEQDHPCFTIGIFAKWGEGKTSVLHFIKEKLAAQDYDITMFNPWFFKDQESLIIDFFNTIQKNKSDEIIHAIKNYAPFVAYGLKAVISSVALASSIHTSCLSSLLVRIIDKISNFIKKMPKRLETVAERKEKLNNVLKTKKHIIMIDDVDRLDKEEMHAVFNLIKQTADFDNTIYLVAMDKDIVAQSLSNVYGNGKDNAGYEFLEKVFQLQLYLPKVQKNRLLKMFTDSLSDVFNSKELKSQEKQKEIENAKEQFENYVLPVINSARQIKQIVNILLLNIPLIGKEVNICDLVLLNSLKIVYPHGYDMIRNNKLRVLGGLTAREQIKVTEEENIKDRIDETTKNKIRIKFLTDMKNDISEDKKIYISELIDVLLNIPFINYNIESNNITADRNFDKYFLLDTPDGEMPYEVIYGDFMNYVADESNYESLISYFVGVETEYGESELKRALRLVTSKFLHEATDLSKIKKICISLSMMKDNILEINASLSGTNGWYSVIEDLLSRMLITYGIKKYQYLDKKTVFETLTEILKNADSIVLLHIVTTINYYSRSYTDDIQFKQLCVDCMHKIISQHGVDLLMSYYVNELIPFLQNWKDIDCDDYNRVIDEWLDSDDADILGLTTRFIQNSTNANYIQLFFELFNYECIHKKLLIIEKTKGDEHLSQSELFAITHFMEYYDGIKSKDNNV